MNMAHPIQCESQRQSPSQDHQTDHHTQQQDQSFYADLNAPLPPLPSSAISTTHTHQLAPLQLERNQSFFDEMDSYLQENPSAIAASVFHPTKGFPLPLPPSTMEGKGQDKQQEYQQEVHGLQNQIVLDRQVDAHATPVRQLGTSTTATEASTTTTMGATATTTTTTTTATTTTMTMTAAVAGQENSSPGLVLLSPPLPSSSSSSPSLTPLSFQHQQQQLQSPDDSMSIQYQQPPYVPYPQSPPTTSHSSYNGSSHSNVIPSLDLQQPHLHQQQQQQQQPYLPPPPPSNDGLPALHRISLSDNGPIVNGIHNAIVPPFPQQQRLVHQHSRNLSQPPLMIPTQEQPIPAKSEDWAALVDTPASPIHAHPSQRLGPAPFQQMPSTQSGGYNRNINTSSGVGSMLPPPPPSLDGLNMGGYTDSPGFEHSGDDYLLQGHVPLNSSLDPSFNTLPHRPHIHANTDPAPMGQQPHQPHHAHHKSFSGIEGPSDSAHFTNPHMGLPTNRQAQRMSWSPNSIDSGIDTSLQQQQHGQHGHHGYLTPPRRYDANGGGSPHSHGGHSKQGSVATSVSLLTDAAIVAKYRETAIKTNDASIQLSYAKYLLEIGEAPSPASPDDNSPPRNSPSPPSSSNAPMPSPTEQEGNGKKQLTLEAIYWIDRLAKEGQPEAQYIRGSWYEDGIYNSKKNADKALRWYQSASKGDFGPAHYKVAFYCEKKKDNNKAVMLYKKAAIHNDVPANHRLAMVYLYGELGQSKNMKAGLQYLKRAASFATEGCPMAPYVLALILAREYKQLAIPDDVAFPDDGEALEWFKKSAALGYGPANYKLGFCYEYGLLGCVIDPFLSVKHYERAVIAGDGNGEAEMALSGWYLSGAENCFPAQDHLAFQYAAKAAERKLPKAQYAMGYYHEVGIATPTDMQKAMEFYKLAAANGNKEAQTRLTEQAAAFDKLGHKNSIRRIKQGRSAKDNNCNVM